MSPSQVELASSIATRDYQGQTDQVGAPYIDHPEMVASYVEALPEFAAGDHHTQQDALAAAWLHDVIEDTDETRESLAAAGISERTVEAVVALTRTPQVSPDDYYATIKSLPVALMVKTADLASNLAPERVAQLDEATCVRLAAKYAHALEELGVERSVITALHASRTGR